MGTGEAGVNRLAVGSTAANRLWHGLQFFFGFVLNNLLGKALK